MGVQEFLWTFSLPIQEEGVLWIFITLKNPSPWPGFELATFGSSGQYTNHYTTKVTSRNVKVKIYKTVILIVVLYGCETWSLTLMEEHRLSV
jgi:hypothetical protein